MRHPIVLLSDRIHVVIRQLAVLAVAVMFVTVMFQIVARYIFASPPPWTEDVARYMMVWTGMMGATLSFKTGTDAVLMDSILPPRPSWLGWLSDCIHALAVLTFIGPVIWFSLFSIRGEFGRGYLGRQAGLTSESLGIPMVWISCIVPVAMIIIAIHLAAHMVTGNIRRLRNDQP